MQRLLWANLRTVWNRAPDLILWTNDISTVVNPIVKNQRISRCASDTSTLNSDGFVTIGDSAQKSWWLTNSFVPNRTPESWCYLPQFSGFSIAWNSLSQQSPFASRRQLPRRAKARIHVEAFMTFDMYRVDFDEQCASRLQAQRNPSCAEYAPVNYVGVRRQESPTCDWPTDAGGFESLDANKFCWLVEICKDPSLA